MKNLTLYALAAALYVIGGAFRKYSHGLKSYFRKEAVFGLAQQDRQERQEQAEVGERVIRAWLPGRSRRQRRRAGKPLEEIDGLGFPRQLAELGLELLPG